MMRRAEAAGRRGVMVIGTGAERTQSLDASLNRVETLLAELVGRCEPVACVGVETAQSFGGVVAHDIVSPQSSPAADEALIDGCAVNSADLIGSSPMSPAFAMVEPRRVCVGDQMPSDCDAVIDAELVAGDQAPFEIHASVAPGEGVRRAGDDFAEGGLIVRAGARLSEIDVWALAMAGVGSVTVRRPRLRIITTDDAAGVRASADLLAGLAAFEGAAIERREAGLRTAEDASNELSGDCDAAFVIGGTGMGSGARAVAALRAGGFKIAHGLALDPGRTGAAGFAHAKPFLCAPGRFEAALGVYLALGRPLLRRLAGASAPPLAMCAPLARKIASSVGISQVVFLHLADGMWAPIGVGDLTLAGLVRSSAYLIIPEASEGLAEGAVIQPLALPGRSVFQ